jgi:hypothetical protein
MKFYKIEKTGRAKNWSNSSVTPIGRQIQIRWLFAVSFVLALLSALPAYGQNPQCVRCVNTNCVRQGNIGGCACAETMHGGCATCGACVAPRCVAPCPVPPPAPDQLQAHTVPPTTEQLQAHPWMIDDSLPTKVTAYSQALGHLLGEEQQLLKRGWCVNFRRGDNLAAPDDKSTEYKWEMISRSGDVDEYRVKHINNGKEERIILLKTQWIILGEDSVDLIAQGEISGTKTLQ